MKFSFKMKKAVFALAFCALAIPAYGDFLQVTSKVIDKFSLSSNDTVFGKLEFLGGIDMTSADGTLGAWSSILFRPDHKHFVGVLDTGHWITGEIERGPNGHLDGIKDATITSMIDKNGKANADKWRMDSEGVALRQGQVLVGFERKHRVDIYPDPGFETSKPIGKIDKLIPNSKLVSNRSLETMLVAPENGPLAGAAMVISEESLNKNGNMYAAVLEGPRKGIFYVKRHAPFDVTDGTFLPNGDLVLLERSFGLLTGLEMRMRLIHTDNIKPGTTIDGDALIQAGSDTQIDNMEGVDSFTAEDGSTHLIMISDDNHSLLQRNLMLEFKLLPQ